MPPIRKRPTRYTRKRPVRRYKRKGAGRRYFKRQQTSINRTLMPPRKYTSMVYTSALINQTPSTGILWSQFVAGGLYDPTGSGSGSPPQPLGFDQMANFYSRYRVNGVKVMVEGYVMTAGQCMCVAIGYDDDTTLPTSLSQMKNQRKYKCRMLNSQKPFKFTRYIPLNVLHSRTKKQYQAEDNYVGVLQSAGGSNPADAGYINVAVVNIDETTATHILYRVSLVFYCCLSELRVLANS